MILEKQKIILVSVKRMLPLLMLFILMISSKLYAQDTNKVALRQRPSSLYLRAPEVIPGTLPEMREPSYWIAKMRNPDKVVMTLEEIRARNKDYVQRMNNFNQLDSNLQKQINHELSSRPGLLAFIPDIDSKTPDELSALTRNMVDKEIKFLRRGYFGNILSIQYSDQELKAIEDELAFDKIVNQKKIQSGITIQDSRLRIIPGLRPEYIGNTGKTGWDMWNFDIVPIGSLVRVLHISKSGGFLFVLTKKGYGWVNSEEVAIGPKDKINNFYKAKDFVVCTGDRVPFYSNPNCTYVSGYFRMGDHLPVVRTNTRMIQVPTRQLNGELLIQNAWLKPDADIHKGYIPYTRKNVVIQAFKLLDNIYDWTGGWYGRDHATQIRDIFSVFGFKFPSMGGLLTAYSDSKRVLYPKDGIEAQKKVILDNEPFLTLQICSSGHSQIYLGNYNGVPIVFDTHGYGYTDKKGNELVIRRCNIGTIAFPDYFLKQEIRFVELK
jgi:hypothetical protein